MTWLPSVTLILQVVLVGLVIYSKRYITEKGKNQATKEDIAEITGLVKRVETQFQIELGRHSLRNELLSKAAELFYELELVVGDLTEKHGTKNLDTENLPYDDKRKMLELLAQVNALFAKLYLTMPDETYKTVIDAVPDRVGTWSELRAAALVSLRGAQFPDSQYLDSKSLRSFSI